MKPLVAIVYLSYNAVPYLDEVFTSLERLQYPKDRLRLIVVDNASSDGSAERIRKEYLPKSQGTLPQMILLPQEKNTGFARGNNIGIERALLDGCDYVYLLNNDAKLHPEAMDRAVAMAESDPTIGSVQSLLLLWQQPDVINSSGGMQHFLGLGYARHNGIPLNQVSMSDGEEIAYASGAGVLLRAHVLQTVGLLDPFLFLYHEDLELGWRMRLAGYRNVLCASSIAYHHYEFQRSIKKYFWMERNRGLVLCSHGRYSTLILLAPWLLGLEVTLFILAIKGGWMKEKLLAWCIWFSPKTWTYLKKKRRDSALLRTISDREIVRIWTGAIAYQELPFSRLTKMGDKALSFLWICLKPLIR
ncbi:TPA: hypothetical protein DEP34_02700 [Candidatus Uhrbacteria bacterium]|uniref:Glycosyl transferase family 2 n=2 Tax=Candidatus Uhriibacteriota TaxID=1752732 RepID=A0A0G1Q728_9BACT|nr:MAG: Glycosyl transferase family 2 [Candidatus Uhrbacteria bacterium GW2011_GWF2_46_218]KKU40804.1 MAG: Glycosyl transferase family 2 [Candidatus Uhrbacteria bacterium GW2011_GWE2_46_68]HBK34203.1 hypothetical protein [Candidatus Uhrbacteria bacterium]HCB19271.1 hypothetical protein [Candidatus Uhrbacteria bacterium]